MHKPRCKLRTAMMLVIAFALMSWLGAVYYKTSRQDKQLHLHYWHGGELHSLNVGSPIVTLTPVPFWSMYWRNCLGLKWDWHFRCQTDADRETDVCELDRALEDGKTLAEDSSGIAAELRKAASESK